MKKNNKILFAGVLVLSLIGLNSCLFKDDIGDELSTGTIVGGGVLHSGQADNINYRKEITESGFKWAKEKMDGEGIIGMIQNAQSSMHGGKDGNDPGPHAYQYQFSLQVDNYVGYMCAPQNFGGRLASTYHNSEDFNGGAMGLFMQVKSFTVPMLNYPQIDSIPELKAIALLIYNYSAQEVADIYGPFPYADYKRNKQSSPFTFDALDDIYCTIVNNIDTIVACLDHYDSRPKWYKDGVRNILANNDRITLGKDVVSWKRFANSLKLRMAMNIVKVEPELARQWAEQSVVSGVVDTWQQQIRMRPDEIGFSHPLNTISTVWNDTRLNASLETILKAYNHPILEFLFTKNSDPITNKKTNTTVKANSIVVGLRAGMQMKQGQSSDVNSRCAYSGINGVAITNMPLFYMKLSEVQFLRAEGALRGWNMGGSAAGFYHDGVENAYKETLLVAFDEEWEEHEFDRDYYSSYLNSYLKIEKAKSIVYVDPEDEANNAESLVTVGVRWNEGDSNEEKLEKIITQKYIAGFPYSFSAWTDLRRTGYPRIFPVLATDRGDGSLRPGELIRRIPFSESDEATKEDVLTSGLEALGGPNVQATRLWWDLDVPNF
ncbi:MAG: SusD/RagB family nutrient-binding outer membrane lipoprotein [Breznakibacter sp.]|nr:SusD/RagB family nutrient-binding outer membrane lipoprotein [Breznakibacter sp.]